MKREKRSPVPESRRWTAATARGVLEALQQSGSEDRLDSHVIRHGAPRVPVIRETWKTEEVRREGSSTV